jgi:hypothetical protein
VEKEARAGNASDFALIKTDCCVILKCFAKIFGQIQQQKSTRMGAFLLT